MGTPFTLFFGDLYVGGLTFRGKVLLVVRGTYILGAYIRGALIFGILRYVMNDTDFKGKN